MEIVSVGTPMMWVGFIAFILFMLALDLGVFHRKAHEVSMKEALGWTVAWITLAGLFNVLVFNWFGKEKGLEFLTGYLIEKSLAVDNIFVFVVIFAAFSVPKLYQHRVLFWGVLGALIMRALFIFLGSALVQQFHWILYLFGALLIVTGIKLLVRTDAEVNPQNNVIYKMFAKVIPSTHVYHGDAFTTVENGRRVATPLLLVLLAVEVTDLIFAVDSIPAIFAVTSDPFIVFTSNIFAILGLRSMYFLLAGVVDKLHYLKVGLALVLLFVGFKMVIVDFYKVPITVSLVVIATLIGGSVAASLLFPRKEQTPAVLPPAS